MSQVVSMCSRETPTRWLVATAEVMPNGSEIAPAGYTAQDISGVQYAWGTSRARIVLNASATEHQR